MRKKNNVIEKRRGFCKPVILIDTDDTLINSSEVVIDLLRERYEFTDRIKRIEAEGKSIYDELKKWTYYSFFCKDEDPLRKEIDKASEEIYESEEFWSRIEFKKDIDLMFKKLGKSFKWIINSKGTQKNLEFKREWLEKNLPNGLDYDIVLEYAEWKGKINKEHLVGDIIIDDRADVLLNNNSPVRILLKNFRNTEYNGGFSESKMDLIGEDIYIVNDIKEIIDILEFYKSYKIVE